MPVSPGFCRRALSTCAGLLAAVAALVAGCIVPAAGRDPLAGAVAGQVANAFWAVAASAAVAAALLWVLSARIRVRSAAGMAVLGLITVLILLLALLLNDAGMAYWGGHPAQRGIALAAYAGAAVCLVAATTVLSTAFLLPGRAGTTTGRPAG